MQVPDGASQAVFSQVEDDLTFPMPANRDITNYVVYVGFDPQGAAAASRPAPKAAPKPKPAPPKTTATKTAPAAAPAPSSSSQPRFEPAPPQTPPPGVFAPPPGHN